MAERPFEDLEGLGREIDRLWAKVGTSSSPSSLDAPIPPAPPPPESSPGKQLAWEAVSLLKRQHRDESRGWQELLEGKELSLRAAQQRLALLTQQNAELNQTARLAEHQALERTVQMQAQLDSALGALEAERRQREEESGLLRGLLDQTRQRLAAEQARWREDQRQWEKKEQQLLLDLRELQGMAARHQQEAGKSSDEAGRLSDSLKEAKNAIEKTLSELLRERQLHAQTEKERQAALTKMEESKSHLEELSKLWEEERAQWRELWDRERSTWEAQRTEFASWESRLRTERDAWHSELEAKEKDQLVFTERMTQALRETSELSSRLRGGGPSLPRFSRRGALAVLFAVAVAAAGPWAWKLATRLRLSPAGSQSVGVASPTGLAFDGTMAWAATWDGRLVAFDPQNLEVAVRSAAPTDLAPYHPVAVAFGGQTAWTLDAARARIVRHAASDPGRVLASRPTPGPAPTALAFDGRTLWSYDAVNRALYEHGSDEGSAKSYALELEGVATAMCWIDGKLWVYDGKARQVVAFENRDGLFRAVSRAPLDEPVTALAAGSELVDGRRRARLWALVGPSSARQAPAVLKYDY